MEKINNFKLIGIRPHEKCGKKFLKVLEPGRLYQFYNEYGFYTEKGKFDGVNGEITHYDFKKTVPEDLYKVGNLNVNISAVVGKNGTGKSTLIELMLFSVYSIGRIVKDKLDGKPILSSYADWLDFELKKKTNAKTEFIELYDNYLKMVMRIENNTLEGLRRKRRKEELIFDYLDLLNSYHSEIEKLNESINHLENEQKELLEENTTFQCSLLYLIDKSIYELKITSKLEVKKIEVYSDVTDNLEETTDEPLNFDLKTNFFYSTILNYSHHSLNSDHLGHWINLLFHKNDGYKTPAVINPMREHGNFDINKEVFLSKSRLLINSLFLQLNDLNKKVSITDKQSISSIQLKLIDYSQFKQQIHFIPQPNSQNILKGSDVSQNTIKYILSSNNFFELAIECYTGNFPNVVQDLLNYLLYKVDKIQSNYKAYYEESVPKITPETDKISTLQSTISFLNDDSSHVSYKYHRSIYYLKKVLNHEFEDFLDSIANKNVISLKDYLKKIDILDENYVQTTDDTYELFLRVPPPIFEVEFNLSVTSDLSIKSCRFQDLSSGEQQNIHTINTFIYHLNNLYSVHKESSNSRQKYNYFNAVFDEIELYFHPDFQRKFIDDLLNTLRKHKHLSENPFITGINIVFSTHSPFILSDIPEQNILKLNYQRSPQTTVDKKYSVPLNSNGQTFSANIYDLLANTFFMDESFIGEFARQTIIKLYDELMDSVNKNEVISKEYYESYKTRIDLVSDVILRTRLNDLLNEISLENSDLELQLQEAEKVVEILKKKLNG